MPSLAGLIPILATPFADDGSLDLASLRRLTQFCLDSGVDGVAVNGNASEAFAITAGERRTILREVREVVGGRVPIVVGVNATSTATAIETATDLVDHGASALMVLPPYLVKPSPGQLVEYYEAVASAAGGIDIMIQDAPGPTGVQFPVDTIVALSRIDGISSVKVEAPPTAEKIAAVADACGSAAFAVLGGNNAQLCLDEYASGAVGTMPACEFVDLLRPVLDLWDAGERVVARRRMARLLPLVLMGVQPGIAWSVHKEVLVLRGIIESATVRSPAKPLPGRARLAVRETIEALELEDALALA